MKALRITFAVLVGLLMISALAIPLITGLSWLKGWPEFLAGTLPYVIAFPVMWLILKPLAKKNAKQSLKSYIPTALFLMLLIGTEISGSFFSHQKIVETIHSPSGKNTAIIVKWSGRTKSEAYPVIARFFFEDNEEKCILLPPERADWAYTWLDDDTLEFVFIINDLMDIETGVKVKVNMRW